MYDTLFKNATVLTMHRAQPCFVGDVAVRGGKIAATGAVQGEAKRVIDCTGKLLLPGLVNTHGHVAMCLLRGYADDYTLQKWLYEKVFPAEAKLTARAVLCGVQLGYAEMLRCGVTSVSDMYYFQPQEAEFALSCGMRVNLTNAALCLDPDGWDPKRDRSVLESEEILARYHGASEGRILLDAGVHGEYTSSPRIWEYMADFAKRNGLGMHVHLSETKTEHDECIARWGKTPAAVLAEHGVFDVRAVAAHCTHITDADMDLLAEKGVSCAHNPVSNLKLGSGIARVLEMRRRGMNVALGTDGCCSNNTHDMFEDMKLAALLQKGVSGDPTALSAYDALEMATVNGARAQGRPDVGTVEEGMQADVILLDLDTPMTQPVYEPASAAVYSATGRNVCLSMVQGKVLYENGTWPTIDVERAYAELNSYAVPLIKG